MFASIWGLTFAKPDGSVERAKTACRMDDNTVFEWFRRKTRQLGGVGLGIDIEKLQTEWPTLQEKPRKKKRPRLARAAEKRKGGHHSGRAILSRNSDLTNNLSQLECYVRTSQEQ